MFNQNYILYICIEYRPFHIINYMEGIDYNFYANHLRFQTCLIIDINSFYCNSGKLQKKIIFLAGPLRGGGGAGGGKAGPLRFFFCYLKIKDILFKTTYQNIKTGNVGKVVVTGLL